MDCPVCRSPIENFDINDEAFKAPLEPARLSEFEKRHVPFVVVSRGCSLIPGDSCTDVSVKIGEIEHVMESAHHISFIDFYVNKVFATRMHFTYKRLHPAAKIHLNVDGGTLAVIGRCTVHGRWMKEAKLLPV